MKSAGSLLAPLVGLLLVVATTATAQTPGPNPTQGSAASALSAATRTIEKVRITGISDDQSKLVVATKPPATLGVDKDLKARLREFQPGDVVTIEVAGQGDGQQLKGIAPATIIAPGRWQRFFVLAGSAALWLCVWIALAASLKKDFRKLVVGEDGRYSNSKVQMVLWFGVVVTAYTAVTFCRGWFGGWAYVGGVGIPENLLALSGISAFTLAGAKGITVSKIEAAEEKARGQGKSDVEVARAAAEVKTAVAEGDRSFFANMSLDDRGNPDIGDFQMFVITLLAVVVYSIQIAKFLGAMELRQVITVPDVDSTLLATFGLGQGAYLAKKYASEKP